jgi:hypothetical protein
MSIIVTRIKRRNRNWSGRGLEAVNRLECVGEDAKRVFQKEDDTENKRPIVQIMLEDVLTFRKNNKFYKSLLKQFKRTGNLTSKQMSCLKKDHDRLTVGIQVKKHYSVKIVCKLSEGNLDKTDSHVDTDRKL